MIFKHSTINVLQPQVCLRGFIGLLLTIMMVFPVKANPMTLNDCTISEGCMDFTFLSKTDNGDGSTTFCFELRNNCDKALTWAAFAIPEPALAPANNSFYESPMGISYNIKNTTTNPFLSIRFKTTGQGIVDGESDQFCFDLNTDLANGLDTFQIQGKASNYVNTVMIDIVNCEDVEVTCENQGGDNDGDGVCADEDCDDNDPNLPATPGTMCDDNDPNTDDDVIQADGCTCAGTTIEDCDNVTSGGIVGLGDGGIFTSITICEDSAFVIQNNIAPDGGSGDLEVVWIKSESTEDCGAAFGELAPLNVGAIYNEFMTNGGSPQIGNTSWEFVLDNDGDDLSLSLDNLDASACFVRCARRSGCVSFAGESNIVSVLVENCDPPTTDCFVSDDCMDFAFAGDTENSDGTTTICIDITNNCDHALSYAAFDVMGSALTPTDGSTVEGNLGISYSIENTTNNPFTASLKFETIGEGYKNGDTDQFCFEINTDVAESLDTLTIQTKAGQGVYTVALPLEECDEEPCETDADQDGICAIDDCDDDNPNLPATPGTSCDDGDPNTDNDVIQEDGCTCAGTPPLVICEDLLDGGIIGLGDGGIYSTLTICEDSSLFILNNISPVAGMGTLDVVWIKSESVEDCGAAFEELPGVNLGELYDDFIANGGSPQVANTSWEFVLDEDDDDLTLTLDSLENSACFVRCVRRTGCVEFVGESNIVTVIVDDCNNIIPLTSNNPSFDLYPNPARSYVSLNLEDYLGSNVDIQIINGLGNVVQNITIQGVMSEDVMINTHDLVNGLYTVRISRDGRIPTIKTLMIIDN